MDLLIEAIVWLLRSLFGDPEKPADMSRTQQRGQKRGQRGPYNYGDSTSGSAPKTLEQILEEVRQQAAQGRSAEPPPPPRPPKPPKIPKAEKTPVEEEKKPVPLSESLSTPSEPVGMPVAQTLPRMAQQEHLQRLPESLPEKAEPQQIPAAEAAQAIGKAKKKKKPAAASVPIPAGPVGIDIIRAIRSASPQAKLAAARQAVVISEVFGQPRCRRPLRPGARLF